jgi:hypothetical protein
MAMKDAERLITDMREDAGLRHGAYGCADGNSLREFFAGKGYSFDDLEWENAANSMRLKAADAESAEEILEIREWYRFMRRT